MHPRIRRHLLLALMTGAATVVAIGVARGGTGAALPAASLALAWLSLLLLCAVLLVGPLEALRRGRPPVNHLLRRDLGLWCGITGLLHFWLGTKVSMNSAYLRDVVGQGPALSSPAVRQGIFVWSTIGGFAAVLVVAVLMILSSNRVIERLGAARWKRWQRSSYLLFVLAAGHGVTFQLLEGRRPPVIALLVFLCAAVLAGQFAGLRRARRRAVPAA